jgi:hypothetical protein
VAGTIGSAAYGVAKAVKLRGVRALNCSGSGSTSGIMTAIDWVRTHATKPAVANMSLGGGRSTALNSRGRQREPERLQRLPRLGGGGVHDGCVGQLRPPGVVLELRLVRRRVRAGRRDPLELVHGRDEHDQRNLDGGPARGGRRGALQGHVR